MRIIRAGGSGEGNFEPHSYPTYQTTSRGIMMNAAYPTDHKAGFSVMYDPNVLREFENDLFAGEAGKKLGELAAFWASQHSHDTNYPEEII